MRHVHRPDFPSEPLSLVDTLTRRVTGMLAAMYLLLAVAVTQISLLQRLGYESALVFALLAGWIGGILPLRLSAGRNARTRDFVTLTLTGWLLLLPPMAVLIVNAVFVRNCALFDGALYWLLLPFMTTAFVAALVIFLRMLFGRRAGWLFYAALLLFLLQPFVQIFIQPQLYAYNHVFGMFLGLSWDQTQPPFVTLALFRLSTTAYVVLLLTSAEAMRRLRLPKGGPRIRTAGLLVPFATALIAAAYFLIASDRLGFSSSYAQLHDELGTVHREGPITLVYDSSVIDVAELRFIMDEHAFQLDRVCEDLQVEWEGQLVSYLYPDRETKKRLLGTESSEIARPWRAEMHITRSAWRQSLKHEIVHVVAGRFGPYINRAPFVRVLGLTEGLAMAVEWSWGNRSLHEHSAAMMEYGLLPHARECISTLGFATNSSSVSYVASGSFTRWLMDSLGTVRIRDAYASDDIEGTVDATYDELDTRWRSFLSTVERVRPDSIAAAYAFRRPSLFSAECPRVVTERSREAARLLADGDAPAALRRYREIEALSPNARAVFGMTASLLQDAHYDSVVALTRRYLRDDSRAYSVYPLLLWQAAAAWMLDDTAGTRTALDRLLHERPTGWPTTLAERMRAALDSHPHNAVVREVLLARLLWEEQADSLRRVRAAVLQEQLLRQPADPVLLEEWLRLAAVDDSGRSAAMSMIEGSEALLDRTSQRDTPSGAAIVNGDADAAEWRRSAPRTSVRLLMLCGAIAYRQAAYGKAERLFRSALEMSEWEMERLRLREWLRRCDWQRGRGR